MLSYNIHVNAEAGLKKKEREREKKINRCRDWCVLTETGSRLKEMGSKPQEL